MSVNYSQGIATYLPVHQARGCKVFWQAVSAQLHLVLGVGWLLQQPTASLHSLWWHHPGENRYYGKICIHEHKNSSMTLTGIRENGEITFSLWTVIKTLHSKWNVSNITMTLTSCMRNSVLMRLELSCSEYERCVRRESISSMKMTAGWWHLQH